MCSLGIEPTTFCAGNAMLYHWATGTHTFTYTCIVAGFPLMMDLFLTNTQQFTSQINCWTGVVWIIVMFLSDVWTLILTAPIHCRDTLLSKWCNATFLQICSCKEQSHLHLHLGWPEVRTFSEFSFLGELFVYSIIVFV